MNLQSIRCYRDRKRLVVLRNEQKPNRVSRLLGFLSLILNTDWEGKDGLFELGLGEMDRNLDVSWETELLVPY